MHIWFCATIKISANMTVVETEKENRAGTMINPFIHKLELDTSADKIQVGKFLLYFISSIVYLYMNILLPYQI